MNQVISDFVPQFVMDKVTWEKHTAASTTKLDLGTLRFLDNNLNLAKEIDKDSFLTFLSSKNFFSKHDRALHYDAGLMTSAKWSHYIRQRHGSLWSYTSHW